MDLGLALSLVVSSIALPTSEVVALAPLVLACEGIRLALLPVPQARIRAWAIGTLNATCMLLACLAGPLRLHEQANAGLA